MPKSIKSGQVVVGDIRTELFTSTVSPQPPSLHRTLHWIGGVNGGILYEIIEKIQSLMIENASEPIHLIVTSHGGPTGIGMSFYDSMRTIYKPKLTTVGSGDVDSSGIIIFLTGSTRYITRNTTLLLHLAGRTFDDARRLTVPDLESIIKEDKLKDFQYASVVSERSEGRVSVQEVLDMMAANTVLSAAEAVELGLAHQILE
jgi:ATP-dependent protease ClpP protease subunit